MMIVNDDNDNDNSEKTISRTFLLNKSFHHVYNHLHLVNNTAMDPACKEPRTPSILQ